MQARLPTVQPDTTPLFFFKQSEPEEQVHHSSTTQQRDRVYVHHDAEEQHAPDFRVNTCNID